MRKLGVWCVAFFLTGAVAQAAEPKSKLVKETWDAAFLDGNKIGFFHATCREFTVDGQMIIKTTLAMDLTIKRYEKLAHLKMENGTEETPEGKVTAVFMTQHLGDGKKLDLKGVVEDDQLHVTVDEGKRLDKKIPWNEEVLGLYQQERLFKDRKPKAGDKLTYLSYEPTLTTIVTVRVTVKKEEEVDCLGARKRLLRVEAMPDKIDLGNDKSVQMPKMISWLDKDFSPLRFQMNLAGLGDITLHRTTKAIATAPPTSIAKLTDIGKATLISLNRTIKNPDKTNSAVYRITLKDDDNPTSAFATDSRQEVKNAKGNTFELHVHAVRKPKKVDEEKEADKEFLESCYFLDSDDPKVKANAGEAVGEELDPWEKAQRIEGWVHRNMKINSSTAFCTAGQVAEHLEGDCRQHAVLAAAMCRAVGVPSRTAVGLVYVDRDKSPVMGFHMWTEVWVKGQWVAIDPTFGHNSIGATHLKIADASWHATQSLVPLFPVARVLGKLSIEIVTVDGK